MRLGDSNLQKQVRSHDQDGCHVNICLKHLRLLLQNRTANDLETWYPASYQIPSNDVPGLTFADCQVLLLFRRSYVFLYLGLISYIFDLILIFLFLSVD